MNSEIFEMQDLRGATNASFKEMTWSLMMMSFHEIRKKWEEWKMGQGL